MQMGVYNHSHVCEANCWGHCLLMPGGTTWSCGREMCGADPCSFDASAADGAAPVERTRLLRQQRRVMCVPVLG